MKAVAIVTVCGLIAGLHVATLRADTSGTLQSECKTQLKMSDSACACIGEKAEAELGAKEQQMVVAQVTGDKQLATQLRTQMTVAEMTRAGQFMTDAPGACVNR